MKVIKQRHRLIIMPEDESDTAFLEDTMGFSHEHPEGVVKVECSPTAEDIGTGKRTGEVWSLTIDSLKGNK